VNQGQLIRVGGLAGLVVITTGLFIVPGFSESRRLSGEIRSYSQELRKPNSGPEVIGRLGEELETLRSLADRRMTPIPATSDVAGLIGDLSSMLDEVGLGSREITTGQSETLNEASSMPMTVTLRGTFPAVAEAVHRIEALPRLVRVKRLRVSSNQPRNGEVDRSGIVRADILIDVFYAPRDVLRTASAGEGAER
jgi:Tfp pilus assembly protein PilO